MFAYSRAEDECRSVWLRRYFGESDGLEPCRVCDVCMARKKDGRKKVSPETVAKLVHTGPMTVKELVARFAAEEPDDVLAALDTLIADGRVAIDPTGIIRA